LVVENLSKNIKEEHVREIFGHFGPIRDLKLPIHPVFNVNRGTAYIMYTEIGDAEDAVRAMHDSQIDGMKLDVSL
ncbi:hypothetical protein BS50DRAFT_474229, partial [Corynespora cassiicola Philippines]